MDRLYEQGSISNLEPCRQSGAVVQQALRKARPLIPSVLLRPLLGAFGIWRVHRDHTATFDRRGGLGRIHILMAGVIVADRLSRFARCLASLRTSPPNLSSATA